MISLLEDTKCGNCGHHHARTYPHVCTLLNCTCEDDEFVPFTKSTRHAKSFSYYSDVIRKMKDTETRIRFMLEEVPGMRNTDDWQFLNYYWNYYLGFKVGATYTMERRVQIGAEALPETVRRMKQKVCESELGPLLECNREITEKELTKNDPRFWEIQSEIVKIIKESRYIPTDTDLLRAKGIKHDAIVEAVTMGIREEEDQE